MDIDNLNPDIEKFLTNIARQEKISVDDVLVNIFKSVYPTEYSEWVKVSALETMTLDINLRSSQPTNIQEILDYVVRTVTLYLPATVGCSIILWDAVQEIFILSASSVPGQESQITAQRARNEGGATRWIIDNQDILIVSDTQQDPFGANTMIAEYGIGSYVGIPLINEGQTIGVLYAMNKRIHEFSERDINFLHDMGQIITVAIAKTMLSQQLLVANVDLNAYAHMVAHDLKSPLSTLYGFMQLVQAEDSELEPTLEKYLNEVDKLIDETFIIIDHLLLLAELDTQKERPIQFIDMPTLISNIRLKIDGIIQELGASVILPEDWPSFSGYTPWIDAIFSNLISNALKSGGTPPRVEMGHDSLNNELLFWVQDNGRGLTAEEQAKLFATNTSYSESKGNDYTVGLPVIKRLIEQLGGEIIIDSKVGEGSAFSFTLPQNK